MDASINYNNMSGANDSGGAIQVEEMKLLNPFQSSSLRGVYVCWRVEVSQLTGFHQAFPVLVIISSQGLMHLYELKDLKIDPSIQDISEMKAFHCLVAQSKKVFESSLLAMPFSPAHVHGVVDRSPTFGAQHNNNNNHQHQQQQQQVSCDAAQSSATSMHLVASSLQQIGNDGFIKLIQSVSVDDMDAASTNMSSASCSNSVNVVQGSNNNIHVTVVVSSNGKDVEKATVSR